MFRQTFFGLDVHPQERTIGKQVADFFLPHLTPTHTHVSQRRCPWHNLSIRQHRQRRAPARLSATVRARITSSNRAAVDKPSSTCGLLHFGRCVQIRRTRFASCFIRKLWRDLRIEPLKNPSRVRTYVTPETKKKYVGSVLLLSSSHR